MTPTQRSLVWLRQQGYTAQVVERWNPWARRRQDLFGGIDVVAVRPTSRGVLGVQTTTEAHSTDHLTKLRQEPRLTTWLAAGNRLELFLWGKHGPRGKRKTWRLRRVRLTKNNFPDDRSVEDSLIPRR